MLIQDQIGIIQKLQMFPIPKPVFWLDFFAVSYNKTALTMQQNSDLSRADLTGHSQFRPKKVGWPCPVSSVLKRTPVQDFYFFIMFYHKSKNWRPILPCYISVLQHSMIQEFFAILSAFLVHFTYKICRQIQKIEDLFWQLIFLRFPCDVSIIW